MSQQPKGYYRSESQLFTELCKLREAIVALDPRVPRDNRENTLLIESFIQQSPISVPSAYLLGYPSRLATGTGTPLQRLLPELISAPNTMCYNWDCYTITIYIM